MFWGVMRLEIARLGGGCKERGRRGYERKESGNPRGIPNRQRKVLMDAITGS